jgi:hypothetical protein
MESVSKTVILIGTSLSLCAFTICMVLLLFNSKIFSDFSTGLYWAEEFFLLGKEFIGASVIPALLFENILLASGLKSRINRNDKKI